MKVIFLDTEYSSSTGELAQLAYLLVEDGACRCENRFFRVQEMDEGSYRVNGLSKEWLEANGEDYESARQQVLSDFDGATLVAHNLNSDKHILEKAFGPLPNRYGMCTMYRFARVLRLPGGHPYKMPSLAELMAHYGVAPEAAAQQAQSDFGVDVSAHDARFDAEAVRLCVEAAISRGDCRNLFA